MPPALAEKADLISVHEERIQRLEDGVANTRTDVALMNQSVDQLAINVNALTEKLTEAVEAMKDNAQTVQAVVAKIAGYEEAKKMRILRWKTWGKGAWAVIGGAIAVFFKEAAVALWKKYTHQ